jgi:hypothetical protein
MKGQETISVILITGILIGMVGSVYIWGIPLIEKNRDISLLEGAEEFMNNLNEKIKNVATHGGREQVEIPLGRIYFDSNIKLKAETKNTIYDIGAWISLGENECTKDIGTWGVDDQAVLCVLSEEIGEEYETNYRLDYINLTLGIKTYKIELVGDRDTGKEDNVVVIERVGTDKKGDCIKTLVSISIE